MISTLETVYNLIPWTELTTLLGGILVVYFRKVLKSLSAVQQQVSKNGGSSLLDAVDRIEHKVEELLAINEILQQISNKPLFRADCEGNYSWINVAYMEKFQVALEDVKGSGWLDLLPEKERESVHRVWRNAIKDKRKFEDVFDLFLDTDPPTNMKVRCKSYPIIIKDKLFGYLGSWMVLEDRKVSNENES